MMKHFSLNKLFSLYSKGELNKKDFEGMVYTYYIFNQDKTCLYHWEQHIYEDYISWFYPKMKKAIESYINKGLSFESYMGKFIFISSKEYRTRLIKNSIIEYSTWCARVPDMYVREETPVYNLEKTESLLNKLLENKSKRKDTKRIIALLIKCYYYFSDDFLEKIAEKFNLDKKLLIEMIDKIKKLREEKDNKIYELKERIYSQHYRCLAYENRLKHLNESTVLYKKIEDKLNRTKLRLEKMRKRLASVRTDATNKQVALIMGTSKGTVDSSLYMLKTKFKKMMEKQHLN